MWIAEKKWYRFYIGIDCGVETGFCVWDRHQKKVIDIKTVKIHKAMDLVKNWNHNHHENVFVRIEDARLRKQIPWQNNEKAERGRREGAGYVKRDAVIWEDYLTDLGIEFEMVAPAKNKTKVSNDYFKKLTRYTGVTSKHARDAGMLVVGF